MIDPVDFYRKPLDEQAVILEKEAEQLSYAAMRLWEADRDEAKYKVWRQACDLYILTFQHKTFVEHELFMDHQELNEKCELENEPDYEPQKDDCCEDEDD